MRIVILLLLLLSAGSPAFADSSSERSNKASCDRIIANQNNNDNSRLTAASLYAHGKYKGTRCVKRDYVRAFDLLVEAGKGGSRGAWLKEVIYRANEGNPSAISALRKLEAAGHITRNGRHIALK